MGDRNLIGDPAFRVQLVEALRSGGELCFVVLRAQSAGAKDWYIAQDESELESVLGRIPPTGPWGYSDRIEVFATGEFPYRTTDDNAWLREKALGVVEKTGEVVLACRHAGDPELHDVEGAADADVVDEWFSEVRQGERVAGAHPFRHAAGSPGVFVSWNPTTDGEVRPGAY